MRASPAAARGRQLEVALGVDLRVARRAHGLSQASVARAIRIGQTRLSRIERGEGSHATLAEINSVAAAVGLQLVVRCYPARSALRDAAQVALLTELRERIHRSWQFRTEVPVPIPGELRAVDVLIVGNGCTIVVEAWTRLNDLQAQTRAAQLKRKEFGEARLLIVLADTLQNRAALREASRLLGTDFPMSTRGMLTALASPRDPGADGIVILRVGRHRKARLVRSRGR